MSDTRSKKTINALIIVVVIILYTLYTINSGAGTTTVIGVGNGIIGISIDAENSTFVNLSDVTGVHEVTDLSELETDSFEFYGDENLGEFIVIEAGDRVVVANYSSKNATKNMYKQIQKALEK